MQRLGRGRMGSVMVALATMFALIFISLPTPGQD